MLQTARVRFFTIKLYTPYTHKAPAIKNKKKKDKISMISIASYTPGMSHVNNFHINSENGTRYVSAITPSDEESEKPSIITKVNVINIVIIVIAKMIANTVKYPSNRRSVHFIQAGRFLCSTSVVMTTPPHTLKK